jgi:hypothetical protein
MLEDVDGRHEAGHEEEVKIVSVIPGRERIAR